jgi:hypothetical protein
VRDNRVKGDFDYNVVVDEVSKKIRGEDGKDKVS